MTARIPGFSDADMAAIDVLVASNIQLQSAVQDMARLLAATYGVSLQKPDPQPEEPRRRGRHRYGNIIRRAPGDVTAEVVNIETGQIRRYHFLKSDDGTIDVEEL